ECNAPVKYSINTTSTHWAAARNDDEIPPERSPSRGAETSDSGFLRMDRTQSRRTNRPIVLV
ncbi:hypothetical protein, partial [Proteus mirabilis]|uniref:hypothetical protein n=1 Tax=Proteus mirabilis TaxID=584 RepID=UPI00236271F6